jgi:hypothetical protein
VIQRVSSGPCLGERVSALADGSMAPDAAMRALAHVSSCADCRQALEVERLTVERLRSLPSPAPSGDLMMALLRLGEPGNPVPLRRRALPGGARPATTAVAPPAGRATAAWPGTTRPQGTRRPGRRGLMQRRAVLTAAGALGVGMLSLGAANLPGAVAPGGPGARPPVDRISVDQAVDRARVHEAVLRQLTSGRSRRPAPLPAVVSGRGVTGTTPSSSTAGPSTAGPWTSSPWTARTTTGAVLGTTGPVLLRH